MTTNISRPKHGDRIRLVRLADPEPEAGETWENRPDLPPGTEGTVIGDTPNNEFLIDVAWDNGLNYMLVFSKDLFEIVAVAAVAADRKRHLAGMTPEERKSTGPTTMTRSGPATPFTRGGRGLDRADVEA